MQMINLCIYAYILHMFDLIIDVDNCSPNHCQNSGECKDGIDSFTCSCPDGFIGDLCETGDYFQTVLLLKRPIL